LLGHQKGQSVLKLWKNSCRKGLPSKGKIPSGQSTEEDCEKEASERSSGVVPGDLLKGMAEKVDTERGRGIYHQRIGIAEPVFANIWAVKRLDRFTLRGKIKVKIHWVLYCMVRNINTRKVFCLLPIL
jgi:hypothetical protein